MPDPCPAVEAFRRACRERAEFYEREADMFRRLADQMAGVDLDGELVTRLWGGLSEATPGMPRPKPKGKR